MARSGRLSAGLIVSVSILAAATPGCDACARTGKTNFRSDTSDLAKSYRKAVDAGREAGFSDEEIHRIMRKAIENDR